MLQGRRRPDYRASTSLAALGVRRGALVAAPAYGGRAFHFATRALTPSYRTGSAANPWMSGFFHHFKNNIKAGWATNSSKFGVRDYAILGVPPAICLGIYFWKRDTEDMQPVREAKAQAKALRAANTATKKQKSARDNSRKK